MKPSPEALERYELRPAAAGRLPLDWTAAFGRAAPLAVELGYGSGEYLAWWAASRPDWNLVGIELPPECTVRASARCAEAGLGNVRLVRGDARYLLRELFPTGSLQHVLMQFPMPWPKGRHAKHRVTRRGLGATLADVLGTGGSFELVTDQEWFASQARALLAEHGTLAVGAVEEGPERPFLTRYERKWRAEGRRTFRLEARQEGAPTPAPRHVLDAAMLSLHFDVFPEPELLHALVGARFAGGGLVGEVKEVFAGSDGWLLKVLSADENFSQVFFLRLLRRARGGALLRVEDGPRPYYTPAVSFLIAQVGAALRAEAAAG
ncbi:MAG TPA: tRNA (guanosine(46)-N7)-methyltransferase TrmB [Planctomycetota bacterium]